MYIFIDIGLLGGNHFCRAPAPSLRGRAGERPSFLLHMHIPLWEWNLDVVLVEGVVDALENLAIITIACVNAYPDDNLEDEGRVAQFLEDDADTSLLVDAVEF